jgi:predicted nuclease of predicted toxin-antitoxin system
MLLIELGFEILTIGDILKWGVEDEKIYEYATECRIPIITHDRRFGQIYFESNHAPVTTIILQIVRPHPQNTNKVLKNAFKILETNLREFNENLIIITKNKIRIRSKEESTK